jgi:hypothetical protein
MRNISGLCNVMFNNNLRTAVIKIIKLKIPHSYPLKLGGSRKCVVLKIRVGFTKFESQCPCHSARLTVVRDVSSTLVVMGVAFE